MDGGHSVTEDCRSGKRGLNRAFASLWSVSRYIFELSDYYIFRRCMKQHLSTYRAFFYLLFSPSQARAGGFRFLMYTVCIYIYILPRNIDPICSLERSRHFWRQDRLSSCLRARAYTWRAVCVGGWAGIRWIWPIWPHVWAWARLCGGLR